MGHVEKKKNMHFNLPTNLCILILLLKSLISYNKVFNFSGNATEGNNKIMPPLFGLWWHHKTQTLPMISPPLM